MRTRPAFLVPVSLTLSTLSLLALAAHFLRRGDVGPCLAAVGVLGVLLLVRRPWALRLAQVALALGIAIWGLTAYQLAQQRLAAGDPVARLLAILGAVMVVDALAIALLGTRKVASRYGVLSAP